MKIVRLTVGDMRTNCYIVKAGGEAMVIDPGGDSGFIVRELKGLGGHCRYIVLTHYHFDHTMASDDVRRATGARVLMHEKDRPMTDARVDGFLEEGDILELGDEKFRVFSLPGHSPGSICLASENDIFSGDLVFGDGIGRTDLPGGSEREMEDSLVRFRAIIKPGLVVHPGHGGEFSVK